MHYTFGAVRGLSGCVRFLKASGPSVLIGIPASADIISLPLKQVSLRFIYKTALRHFVRLDVRSWVFEKKKLPREAIAHHLIPRQNIYD